jgi:hypothetical protein
LVVESLLKDVYSHDEAVYRRLLSCR